MMCEHDWVWAGESVSVCSKCQKSAFINSSIEKHLRLWAKVQNDKVNRLIKRSSNEPESFRSGFDTGYKIALLELERFLSKVRDQ